MTGAQVSGETTRLKVKVEDLLMKFDEVSGSVESLKSDCRPPGRPPDSR